MGAVNQAIVQRNLQNSVQLEKNNLDKVSIERAVNQPCDQKRNSSLNHDADLSKNKIRCNIDNMDFNKDKKERDSVIDRKQEKSTKQVINLLLDSGQSVTITSYSGIKKKDIEQYLGHIKKIEFKEGFNEDQKKLFSDSEYLDKHHRLFTVLKVIVKVCAFAYQVYSILYPILSGQFISTVINTLSHGKIFKNCISKGETNELGLSLLS